MRHGRDLIINGEIILSGPVLADEWASWMWDEDVFFCPRQLREALAETGDGPVTIRMNSVGGHVSAGIEMRSILAEHSQQVRLVVEGYAMSAATLLMMGAARREMSADSLFMIHDPSSMVWGTQQDMLAEASLLDKLSASAAQVYARASGMSEEDVRAAMTAETYYTAQEAVQAGFIHAISDDHQPEEAGQSMRRMQAGPAARERAAAAMMEASALVSSRRAAGRMPSLLAHRNAPAAPTITVTGATLAPCGPAAQSGAPALMATTEEAVMPENEQAVQTAAHNQTQTPPASAPQSAQAAVAAERQRCSTIQSIAQPYIDSGRIEQSQVTAMIESGASTEMASQQMLTVMAGAEPPASRSAARVVRDEGETRMEGMIGALMGQTEGPAQQYRGLRLRRLAIELSGAQRGYNDIDAIRRGMTAHTMAGGAHGVSDFAYITTEVMNRTLMDAYQRRAATWQAVCGAPVSAADFRELHSVRFGGDFKLKPVKENGEYESAVLDDQAEGLRVERRGRTIKLTFEAVVNDDMGAFARIPNEFAMAARTMESQMVWSLIRSNAVLKSDGNPLFHTSRSNTVAAAAISVTSVGAARKRMWEQRAFGSKDTDDFLQIEPNRLIVPPALEVEALQFTGATVPTKDDEGNPFKTTLTPIVVPNLGAAAGGHDNRWYLVSSDLPPIAHAYLEGYSAPTVVTIEGMNPDVVTMNARHIFGAAASEPRGAQRVGQ